MTYGRGRTYNSFQYNSILSSPAQDIYTGTVNILRTERVNAQITRTAQKTAYITRSATFRTEF